jgi:phage shock protein A
MTNTVRLILSRAKLGAMKVEVAAMKAACERIRKSNGGVVPTSLEYMAEEMDERIAEWEIKLVAAEELLAATHQRP